MENASKALIIAGAILISILLISVGIIIMNAINDPLQQGADTAASQSIEMFNSKLLTYDGKLKGSELKTLTSTVNAINATDDTHQVALTTDSVTSLSSLKATKEYTVEVKYATVDGENTIAGAKKIAPSASATKVQSEKGYICEVYISGTGTATP